MNEYRAQAGIHCIDIDTIASHIDIRLNEMKSKNNICQRDYVLVRPHILRIQ